jgi:hypothetical protein
MKQSMPISYVTEQVCEHLYNMSVPDQTEVLHHNFGIDVEDTEDGVVWEGTIITDAKFDQNFMEIIESMDVSTILTVFSEIVNYECDLDENNNVMWDDEN